MGYRDRGGVNNKGCNNVVDVGVKEIWTNDMVEYFVERCEEIKNDEKNSHYADDSGFDDMEEVGEDVSGSANFVTQNEVSSDIDGSMAQMQGGLAAHPSNLQ
ncbi:hypothetical protein Tco_0259454 [Tanacetum coccineum]